MSDNPFYRLAPFIQEFIYRQAWDELRVVQAETARALFDTSHHVLVMSGTASGKTEAAFLPILTDLHNRPARSIGALYIGPLKALINDQFERLQAILVESNIPVQSWHGDVDRTRKMKFLQQAQGVLQITPESLEAMLMLRHVDLGRLFGDLRYVVIDEAHAFMSSDRGRQIMCQLGRLERYQPARPRRIGLSATLGDPEQAMQWLAGNTDVPVTLVKDPVGKRTIELALWHFDGLPKDFNELKAAAHATGNSIELSRLAKLEMSNRALFKHIYEQTQGKKSIIFTNTRGDAERVIGQIRDIAQQAKTPDIYYVHHGSVSAQLREAAEAAMHTGGQPACTGATLTLELGIDIGQLDQTLQLGMAHTVSSFVQRLGRSGRRGDPARMLFYHEEIPIDEKTRLGNQLPWGLLQTIAIIQLYVEEKWIEPVKAPELPFSLLYHQTMSTLVSHTELSPAELAEQILPLSPFSKVSQEQYRMLLKHLLEIRHIERIEDGGLIVGVQAEKIVNNYRFYATFVDETEFIVRDGSREIGTLQAAPAIGDRLALAGFTWKVLDIDTERRVIKVERVPGKADSTWTGGYGNIHDRVIERIRKILIETNEYGYLQPDALWRLRQARALAGEYGFATRPVSPLGGDAVIVFPWKGSLISNTLRLMLEQRGARIKFAFPPYFLEIGNIPGDNVAAQTLFRAILQRPPTASELAERVSPALLSIAKYDPYVPEALLRQAYSRDQLAVEPTLSLIRSLSR
ncbi:MAG: DEAD/DEAH box helicase [Aggregatilineales bacterium]